MYWFPQLYIILNLLGATFCGALAFAVPPRNENRNFSFSLFIITVGIWCLLSALFFINTSIHDFWLWNGMLVIPYVLLPVFWLNFIANTTRSQIPPLQVLCIVPTLTLLVYWIKPLSFLMWTIDHYRYQWGFPIANFKRGVWFNYVHIPYSYALVIAGLFILARSYLHTSKNFKEPHLILFIVGLVPLILSGLNLLSVFQDSNFYDITPLGYTVSSTIFCIATSRFWLLYRSPLVYEAIFSSIQNAILVFDSNRQLIEANAAAHQLLTTCNLEKHQTFSRVLPFLDSDKAADLWQFGQIEVNYHSYALDISQFPIQEGTTVVGSVISIMDNTQARQLEKQLLEGALLYDALTNLPNRTLFHDRLAQASKYFQRYSNVPYAVLFLDLDRFKIFNDSLGHHAGDEILREVARRLVSCLRAHDTVARLGGDEFAILTEKVNPEEVRHLCQRIQASIQQPILVNSRKLQTSVSIGVAFSTEEMSPEQILQNADLAMYQTKSRGKAGFTIYNHKLHQQLATSMQLEVDIQAALRKEEFFIEFQPIVCIQTNKIIGFESLIRWSHPAKGIIPPIKFIQVAEEIGVISELDQWVLKQACQQLSRWNQHFEDHKLTLSINLSVANFSNPNLLKAITQTIRHYDISGSQLKLEITESLLMKNPGYISRVLRELKDLGIGIQLDDFGTGHSSLSYLHQLPLDALKIDRSFVMNANQTDQGSTIIKSIIDLAHNLKLQVIGEGVESESQRELLKHLGCQYGQGYFWKPPQSSEDATRLVAKQQRYLNGVDSPHSQKSIFSG